MKPAGEWSEWEQLWQADRTSPERLEELIERTRRARRSLRLTRRLSTVLAVVALGVVGAALRHAGNAFEVTLGVVSVSASLPCGSWISPTSGTRQPRSTRPRRSTSP